MTTEIKRIHVTLDSESTPLLEAASEHPVLLEKDGELYRFSREKKKELSQDAYTAFRSAAGGWADVDSEHLKKMVYASRQLRTRPPVDL
jgi:hypothetical protein